MKSVRYILLMLMIFCLFPLSAQAEKLKKNVLYINSYHHGYRWSDGILEGIRSVLDESDYKIDLQVEYMDAKRYDYEEVSAMLLRLYSEKFKKEQFDVVILSDNDAFEFATKYRNELFPGVPLVFCGVNDLHMSALNQRNVTGVEENFDLMLTLDVALRLHPDKRHMVVVGDESSAGVAIRKQIETVVPLYEDKLKVDYWTHLDLGEMLDRVESVPLDTFLFFIPFYQTVGGKLEVASENWTTA